MTGHATEQRTHLAVAFDTKELNGDQGQEKWRNPRGISDAMRSWPVVDDVTSSGDLERQDSEPANGVLPTTGKAPGWIYKSTDVHGEGSVNWVHDCKFGQCLHHQVHHNADEGKSDDNSGRSTSGEG
jgi:hypothetical protein